MHPLERYLTELRDIRATGAGIPDFGLFAAGRIARARRERGEGRCLFVTPTERKFELIRAKVKPIYG